MFWNRKALSSPLGVPLGDLLALLEPTSIRATVEGPTLIARHEHCTTRIEVVSPARRESENGPIRAVVRVVTDLPAALQCLTAEGSPEALAAFNAMSALGALHTEGPAIRIGSRLTIYEAEDAWRTLHLPLLAFTTICAAEALIGGMRRSLGGEPHRGGSSHWTERDFAQAERYLSGLGVCTTGGLGLTVEFALGDGPGSAIAGDHRTALFQLMGDQPHPELGGGLVCLLQMPHRVADAARLARICEQLNRMEMAPHDLPPHFGAWCPGRLGDNPAYVSFLPNALHPVKGIAVNTGFWAFNRAQWANAMLASLGVRAA